MKLTVDELYEVLVAFREHLVPCWRRYHEDGRSNFNRNMDGSVPEIVSTLTCRHTSAFLYKHLKALGLDDLRARGGMMRHAEPLGAEEFYDNSRKDASDPSWRIVDEDGYMWEPHYWLEHGDLVVDITKDQFGWEFSDIHDLEIAEMIYEAKPALCGNGLLRGLKSTVSKFEGEAQTYWQDRDPHFQEVRESFELTMKRVRDLIPSSANAAAMR
ncbi:hypothetical protein G6L37_00710 [Agrobacterium rubi]|nr:hypothetical protein [Agrobacterium rubi]NTF23911.1 hypothetical protein [Agrobacterium rubi]